MQQTDVEDFCLPTQKRDRMMRCGLHTWPCFESDTARNALSTALSIAIVIAWIGVEFAPLGRWWDVGAIVFLAAQAWMIRNWLKELRKPELTKSGRYALRGMIIGYTILFVAVLIGLLSVLGT